MGHLKNRKANDIEIYQLVTYPTIYCVTVLLGISIPRRKLANQSGENLLSFV